MEKTSIFHDFPSDFGSKGVPGDVNAHVEVHIERVDHREADGEVVRGHREEGEDAGAQDPLAPGPHENDPKSPSKQGKRAITAIFCRKNHENPWEKP